MDEREALLRAVAANPDEDTPRLMYADLLDELGGDANTARARFIRVQIDLARNPGRSWFASSDRLSEGARLAGQFADVWLNELPEWAADAARKQKLRADDFPRGFLNEFHIRPAAFAKNGPELLDIAPVTRLVAKGPFSPPDLPALLGAPLLTRVRALALTHSTGDHTAVLVRTSPVLYALEQLDLSVSSLSDTGAALLTQSPGLSNLRILTVRGNRLTERGVESLLSARNLPNLRELDARGAADGYRWGPRVQKRFPKKTLLV
ncbi:MAG TPA: TIGR02996 domain-containing protein [Gemmata sp.]